MSNTTLSAEIIAKEALMQLENTLVMGANVHRDYVKEWDAKPGSTVTIRKPVKFRAKDGATLDEVDVYERSTSLVVDKRKHVAWNFTTSELSLNIDDYSTRYIRPAVTALANQVDADLCALYADVFNEVGTPGTVPDSFAEVAAASRRLDDEAVPMDGRILACNPYTAWEIASGVVSLYNPGMVESAARRGIVTEFAGFKVMADQNVKAHTVGNHGGTPLMNGATAEGASELVTDGWTASAAILKKGDVFTVAGVYSVNPVSGQSTGVLRQFTATADVTADGSGNATIPISPQIYSAAADEDKLPYQTVDALPADGAAITVSGTAGNQYVKNMAFHPNAFALVSVPLALPEGAWCARESHNGLSIRVIKDYDIANDTEKIRLDVLYGVKTLYPELACRLTA